MNFASKAIRTQVRLFLPGSEQAFRVASGVMVDLLDAMPILLSPDVQHEVLQSRELCSISKVLRLALSVVERGQAWPKAVADGARHPV